MGELKTRYKILIGAFILLGIIITLGFTYIPDKLSEWNDSLAKPPEPLEEEEINELIATVPEETNDDITEQFPKDMSETQVMDAIHHMSHQKIKAKDNKKWGALQITPERIDRLIEVVQANDYKHSELYLSILEEWKAESFDNSVRAHNAIWKLKNGTIGEAERLLTVEEEAWYIKENFK